MAFVRSQGIEVLSVPSNPIRTDCCGGSNNETTCTYGNGGQNGSCAPSWIYGHDTDEVRLCITNTLAIRHTATATPGPVLSGALTGSISGSTNGTDNDGGVKTQW
jgi:hypothetical protein